MPVQVLVIGGGVAGCSAAVELSRRGAGVTLVDRDQPGTGATGASAGMLAPQYEAGGPGAVFRFSVESRALWPEFALRLEALADWPVGFREEGMLVANRTREEEEGAIQDLAWQNQAGLPGEILASGEAQRLHRGVNMAFPSYTWLPWEAQVDVQRLAVALADAVRGEGGSVLAGAPVAGILSEGGRAVGAVLQDGTRLAADRVILAAGAWSSRVSGLPRDLPVAPIRGQIVRLLPEAPPPWPLLTDHQGRYLVPRENGTLLVGSTTEDVGYDESITEEGRAVLTEAALELFPALEGACLVERWAGLRPMTPDALPLLGPDPRLKGLHYATGYGRNGILMAPLAARVLADLVIEGHSTVNWEPFGVARFEESPS
jgi:glycine oxidase